MSCAKGYERNGFEIAVIGMAGRFPGAKDIEEFWQNLRNGIESISFFTDAEMLAAGVEPEQRHGHSAPQYGRMDLPGPDPG
jgi:acyl transferase domain-containing protein